MARGERYIVYNQLRLYSNEAQANAYGSNYASTFTDYHNTSEGNGTPYVATNWGGMDNPFYPAIPIWWVPHWGGSGYFIGWTNDSKNLGASSPTISKANFQSGEEVIIYTNRKNSSFKHTVQWRYGSGSWQTIPNGTNVDAARAWTPTHAEIAGALPTGKRSGTFEIRLRTYSGSTHVGDRIISVTITIPGHNFSISSFVFEDDIPINISKSHTGYSSMIEMYSGTTLLASWTSNVNGPTRLGLISEVKNNIYSMMAKENSRSFRFVCKTMEGSTVLTSVERTAKGTIGGDINPWVGDVLVVETNGIVKDTLGLNYFVQGISTFSVSAPDAVASYGASIEEISMRLGGSQHKKGKVKTHTFNSSSMRETRVTVSVLDSRGRSLSKEIPLVQETYARPVISTFSAKRYDPANQARVNINLNATQTKLSNKNTMRYQVHARKAETTTWSQRKAWSGYQIGNFNLSATVIDNIADDGPWEVRVTVQDRIGTESTLIFTLTSSQKTVMKITDGNTMEFFVDTLKKGSENILTTGSSLAANKLSGTIPSGNMPWIPASWVNSGNLSKDRMPINPAPTRLSLQNGWSGDILYMKDFTGMVHVMGKNLDPGTAKSAMGTLPTSHRPNSSQYFQVYIGNVPPYELKGGIRIRSNGDISLVNPARDEVPNNSTPKLAFTVAYRPEL